MTKAELNEKLLRILGSRKFHALVLSLAVVLLSGWAYGQGYVFTPEMANRMLIVLGAYAGLSVAEDGLFYISGGNKEEGVLLEATVERTGGGVG